MLGRKRTMLDEHMQISLDQLKLLHSSGSMRFHLSLAQLEER